jgi:hypothetical protein
VAWAKIEFLKPFGSPPFSGTPIVGKGKSGPLEEPRDVTAGLVRKRRIVADYHLCKLLKDVIAELHGIHSSSKP